MIIHKSKEIVQQKRSMNAKSSSGKFIIRDTDTDTEEVDYLQNFGNGRKIEITTTNLLLQWLKQYVLQLKGSLDSIQNVLRSLYGTVRVGSNLSKFLLVSNILYDSFITYGHNRNKQNIHIWKQKN
ncbi:PREDICTED: uncharacterized protein LOC108971134 [Bactrocera latifrons]|uniref:uncharacterized protein LOC108971134 n=1 Tax=Bactrocera latifrons TaxID=174628 RepID=UPI0008DE099E|nr:PREDICTED: uncharacterized protein LOC108971134 [Bactrocera latifrons]